MNNYTEFLRDKTAMKRNDGISNMRFENGESAWAHCWDLCKSGILRVKSQKVSGMGYHDTFFLNIKVA